MAPVGRPATREDYIAFYGEAPKRSLRAYVLDLDGRILGVGGIRYQNPGQPPFLFSDIKPEARQWPKEMVKAAKMALADFGPAPILAIADPHEKGSIRLLTYLGFKHFASSVKGEVFRYAPEQRSAA
jgi:RimJ/RimL family protein N-acetyltransferase